MDVDESRARKERDRGEGAEHAQVVYLNELVRDGARLAQTPADRVNKVTCSIETLHASKMSLDCMFASGVVPAHTSAYVVSA